MLWTRLMIRFYLPVLAVFLGLMLLAGDYGTYLPGGDQIAYVSSRDGGVWDVYVMDIQRRLSFNISGWFLRGWVRNRLPMWTPNGRELIFVTEFLRFRGMDIMILNPDVPSLRFLTDSPHDETAPAITAEPPYRLAYEFFNGRNWDIVVERIGHEDVWLAQQVQPFVDGRADDRMPRWSPDGETLAFISNRASIRSDIYLVDADGRNLRRLTRSMEVDEHMAWSPAGTHIAFVTGRDLNREIYLVNVASRAVTNLTRDPGGDYAPEWSPDGEWIAFVSTRDGDDEIYVMDASGDNLQQITHNRVYDSHPVWSPDGTRLLYVSEPSHIGEIMLYDLQTGHSRRLTHNLVDEWWPTWRP